MTLQDFKLKMISELSSIYEMDELNSIFNLLSEDYLKIPRSKILLADEIDLNESNQTLFLSALERLKTHEPIQYVLGKTTFMDLEFKVNNSVLIPRPETEELVDVIIKSEKSNHKKNILDIGTGSGCIAVTLSNHLTSNVFGIEEQYHKDWINNIFIETGDVWVKKQQELQLDYESFFGLDGTDVSLDIQRTFNITVDFTELSSFPSSVEATNCSTLGL